MADPSLHVMATLSTDCIELNEWHVGAGDDERFGYIGGFWVCITDEALFWRVVVI